MRQLSVLLIAVTFLALPAVATAVDLVIEEFLLDPDEADPGGTVIAEWGATVDGDGNVTVPFTIGFYLSTDDSIEISSDRLLQRITEPGPLYSGQLFGTPTAVVIPADTPPGLYYLGLVLDDTNVVAEENEGNNIESDRLTVTGIVTVPNLVAGPCSVAPSTARPGDEVLFTWRGRNSGAATGAFFEWRVLLSTDTTLTTGDTQISRGDVLGGWVAGFDTGNQPVTVTLSPSLPAGSYYVGILLDSSNQITESSETDNQCVSELVVTTASGVTRWLIPAAASSPGLNNTNWKSQVEIVNPTSAGHTANLFYVARGAAWPGSRIEGPVSLPALSASYRDDLLLPLNPTSGLLYVALDAPGPVVTSRTYNLASGGATYGQGIPALPLDGATAPQRLVLPMAHSISGRFHTNLGLVQASTGSYTVEVTLYTEQGLALASHPFTLSTAYDQITNVFDRLGVTASVEGGFIVVRLTAGAPDYWTCYASVVDDLTGDPTFIAPVAP
jgi:hypothetical protein